MLKRRIINTNYKDGLDVNIGDHVTIISHPNFLATPHVGKTGIVIDQWNAKHHKHWRVDIDYVERVLCFDWHELYKIDL